MVQDSDYECGIEIGCISGPRRARSLLPEVAYSIVQFLK
jgi:hypothetical protein